MIAQLQARQFIMDHCMKEKLDERGLLCGLAGGAVLL